MFRRLDEGNVKRQFQLDIDRHNAQYTPFYKLYAPSQANRPQTADDFRQYRRIVFTSGYSIEISIWHIILLSRMRYGQAHVAVGQVDDCQVLVWYCPELGTSAPSGRKGANTSEYFCPFPSAGDRWFRACGAYMQEDSLVRASQIRN